MRPLVADEIGANVAVGTNITEACRTLNPTKSV